MRYNRSYDCAIDSVILSGYLICRSDTRIVSGVASVCYSINEWTTEEQFIFLGNQNDQSSELLSSYEMIYRCTSVPLHNSDPPLYFSNHGGSIFRSRKHRVVSGDFREQDLPAPPPTASEAPNAMQFPCFSLGR